MTRGGREEGRRGTLDDTRRKKLPPLEENQEHGYLTMYGCLNGFPSSVKEAPASVGSPLSGDDTRFIWHHSIGPWRGSPARRQEIKTHCDPLQLVVLLNVNQCE